MSTDGRNKTTWLQCQTCGEIYQIQREVPIEQLYVAAHCPNCGLAIGLNLGYQQEDLYYFYNVNLDRRHYEY